jgi:hypothetical protein
MQYINPVMIVFVTTHRHRHTHRPAQQMTGAPKNTTKPYWRLFHSRSVARATYVLTDFDRLGFWELELAARLYRQLTAAGLRVLNDPALHLGRYAMLRRFHQTGINRFKAWSPSLGEYPDRFPVFLRTQSAHRGTISDLLHDAGSAQAALDAALAEGYPLTELVFIEYAASPSANGLFQKHAAFRIGERVVPAPSVNSRDWVAKNGEIGVAGEEEYKAERARLDETTFTETLMAAFRAADIDYGRADFGVVDGVPQIYEINTNPQISLTTDHPFSPRRETLRISMERYGAALAAVDTAAVGGRVRLDDPMLTRQRRSDRRRLWLRRRTP